MTLIHWSGARITTRPHQMTHEPPPKLFPLFLKLENRPCLVVGAGTIAEGKIAGLLEAEATLRVVAPQATPQIRSWAKEKKLDLHQREFDRRTSRVCSW